jgi:hypothetical protein
VTASELWGALLRGVVILIVFGAILTWAIARAGRR